MNNQTHPTEPETLEWEAVGIEGIPDTDPMVRIASLLVCIRGSQEPIWKLSRSHPNTPGWSRSEIDHYVQKKQIALFQKPIPVQPGEMALCVHPDFLKFFKDKCAESFQQDSLAWYPLPEFGGAVVAVAPLDKLLSLRKWAASRLVPKVRDQLSNICRAMVNKPNEKFDGMFQKFHDFLETALFSVDSVLGEQFLEFLYWQGAAYLLEKYEAGVDDLFKFCCKHIASADSRSDFYEKIRMRRNSVYDEALESAKTVPIINFAVGDVFEKKENSQDNIQGVYNSTFRQTVTNSDNTTSFPKNSVLYASCPSKSSISTASS